MQYSNHETTKDTKTHEEENLKGFLRVPSCFFVTSWLL